MKLPVEQAKKLLEQLDLVLCQMIEHPDNSFKDMDTNSGGLFSVTPANQPILSSPVDLLQRFVEAKANEIPNSVALEFVSGIEADGLRSTTWTYRELNEEGNRVANLILSHGVSKGRIVGICFDKCAEASFAILGILKAGCSYVALDPQAPLARKQFIVKDSHTALVLSFGSEADELRKELSVTVIDLSVALKAEDFSAKAPDLQIEPNDVCYCLYTSGTTGTPKGCEM